MDVIVFLLSLVIVGWAIISLYRTVNPVDEIDIEEEEDDLLQ